MRVLVTNDDGVYGEGLKYLVEFAKKLGDVLVVAPKTEQSAKSHALNIKEPFSIEKIDLGLGVDTYMVDSTPADCVRYAHYGLNADIDLVLSGVNRGYNLGEDIMYSGTVAAATEAATLNIKSLAFSTSRKNFDGVSDNLEKVFKYILDNKLFDIWNLYNINIPNSLEDLEILITSQGDCNFQTTFEPQGNAYYQCGVPCFENSMEKLHLDTAAIMNGYISITPLVYNRTNYEIYKKLKKC